MNRRAFLAGSASALATATAGCLDPEQRAQFADDRSEQSEESTNSTESSESVGDSEDVDVDTERTWVNIEEGRAVWNWRGNLADGLVTCDMVVEATLYDAQYDEIASRRLAVKEANNAGNRAITVVFDATDANDVFTYDVRVEDAEC